MPFEVIRYVYRSKVTMLRKSVQFFDLMKRRRSVRTFSKKAVPRTVIENCIAAAGRSPSGANQQPWQFIAISDRTVKRAIRTAAEACEQSFYDHRASTAWKEALKPLGTDARKPFLETAPWLIAVFAVKYGKMPEHKHYYVNESVGIATGILITALHFCGLAVLTYTPSPMAFLGDILQRPKNEKPFLLLVTGYPARGTTIPQITKKSLQEILSVIE
jgi:iodotyrosine deiodinase